MNPGGQSAPARFDLVRRSIRSSRAAPSVPHRSAGCAGPWFSLACRWIFYTPPLPRHRGPVLLALGPLPHPGGPWSTRLDDHPRPALPAKFLGAPKERRPSALRAQLADRLTCGWLAPLPKRSCVGSWKKWLPAPADLLTVSRWAAAPAVGPPHLRAALFAPGLPAPGRRRATSWRRASVRYGPRGLLQVPGLHRGGRLPNPSLQPRTKTLQQHLPPPTSAPPPARLLLHPSSPCQAAASASSGIRTRSATRKRPARQ